MMSWTPHEPHFNGLRREHETGWWVLLSIKTNLGMEWILWAPVKVRLQDAHPNSRMNLGCISKEEAIIKAEQIIATHSSEGP